MSDNPSSHAPSEQIPIPEDLQKQLAQFQKSLWRIKVTEAVLAGVFGLILSFLLVFFLERFFPLPPLFRLGILLAGTSLAVIFAPYWVRLWVFGHKREEQLARLISKKFPKLGDRLLGIVELQDQHETRDALSPELRKAAMIHVANQAAKRDMSQALPYSRHIKLAIGVATGLAAIIIGVAIAPKAGGNALKRWLMPLSDTQHYTFTQFDRSKMPDPMIVPLGEAFTFAAPLKSDSDKKPASARARYNQQDWIQATLGDDDTYSFDFTGQEASGNITLEAGDAALSITVNPSIRPEPSNFQALINLPDYLQLEPRTLDIRTGSLSTLEGSQVTLKGTFTHQISSATAHFTAQPHDDFQERNTQSPLQPTTPELLAKAKKEAEAEKAARAKTLKVPDPRPLSLTIDGRTVSTEPITLGHFRADIPFTWRAVSGLAGADSFKVGIQTTKDLAPSTYIQGIERNIVILAEETLEFEILNEDDFGLQDIGIAWKGEFTKATEGQPASGSLIIKEGSPSAARLSDRVIFSPQTYGITPQKLQLMSYTQDYKPGRGRVYSEPINIYILTREEHAQILKSRFDRIISQLEDAARKELNNLDKNQRLDQSQTPEDLQNEDNQQKLAKAQEEEAKNAEKMKEIAKTMEELFQDAARNGEVEIETMKDIAEALQNIKELAEQDLPEVEQKLGEAQDQKSTPEKTESDLKKAIEKQKEAVKKMQETIEKTNQANQNFEASTFVNRLKKAATDESGISTILQAALRGETENAVLPILGAAPKSDDIDPVHVRLLKELAKTQRATTSDVRWIQEDLERFHARTQKPIHKEIYEAMTKSLIDEHLERLQGFIGKNRSFTSARLANEWSSTLKKWAEKLEGPKDEAGGGDGGGASGGEGSPEEQDFEFMLKVMRMVQAEQDIRSRTRSLEQMLRSLKLSFKQ